MSLGMGAYADLHQSVVLSAYDNAPEDCLPTSGQLLIGEVHYQNCVILMEIIADKQTDRSFFPSKENASVCLS